MVSCEKWGSRSENGANMLTHKSWPLALNQVALVFRNTHISLARTDSKERVNKFILYTWVDINEIHWRMKSYARSRQKRAAGKVKSKKCTQVSWIIYKKYRSVLSDSTWNIYWEMKIVYWLWLCLEFESLNCSFFFILQVSFGNKRTNSVWKIFFFFSLNILKKNTSFFVVLSLLSV